MLTSTHSRLNTRRDKYRKMNDNKNEIEILSSNSSNSPLVLDAVETDSANVAPDNTSMASEHGYFWVGIKIPKSLVFGGLGYVAGGFVGVYGGSYGVFLAGVLGLHFYYFFV